YNIRTLASRVGVQKAAAGASVVLVLNYISAVAEAAMAPAAAFNRRVMTVGHGLFLAYLWRSFAALRAGEKESVKAFYARIWDLFYAEYLLYPFI
ncbi:unnamed protein product, partial [Phaeothamnion confervicola]